jgi:transcription elongation factor Elf1
MSEVQQNNPSGTEVRGQQRKRQLGSLFECAFCANRYLSREIPYNELGYAVCPVCQYEHGPEYV